MKPIHRSITLLIAATLTMALVAQLTFWTFGQINDDSELRRHTHILLQNSEDLISNLAGAETAQRGFLLTGNATFLQPYLTVQGDTAKLLASLQQMNQSKAARQHLDTAASLIESKLAEMAKIVDFSQKNNFKAALSVMSTGEGKKLMDAIHVEISAFQKVQEELRLQNEARLKANLRQLFFILVAASLFTLFSALIFAFVIYRQAQQNIRNQVHLKTQRALALQEDANIRLQRAYFDLQVSEEKLGVTLNSIGDAVIATDALGRVTFLNPQAGVLTGWTLQEAVGQPIEAIFNIISQQTRLPAAIPVNDALAHGTIQGLTNHVVLITRNGGEHAIADSCAPIRSANSEILGAVLVFRDVSNEYAAQQALVDSNALTQAILNTVADGIVTLHASSGVIETINPAVEVLFGYTADELIGRKFDLLIPGLDQTLRNEIFDPNHIDKNVTTLIQRNEIVGRRNDGSRFPLEMTINQIWLDGERHFAGILHNLTARQAAMESQLESGALQNAIFNSENFSSIATDAKGVIQIFNVGAERMLGYSAAEVMDKITPADFSDPEELVARAKALSAELGTPIAPGFEALVFKASRGIEDIYELTSICKDGSRLPVVLSVTALRDAQNEIIGYLLIGTDNTASKQAEEALLKAGALQKAIFDSANFSSIATDAKGVIQIFNVGAERMLGYAAADVMNKITPADLSDPQELVARAESLSAELNTKITPGFEALVFKAARGIEDIYELTYIRKDGSRFPAVVSVTALRDAQNEIIGYLLIGTDNTASKQAEEALLKAGALQKAIFDSANFSSIATDAKGVIQIFNVGAERMLGYAAADVMNKITPADLSDPQEVIARAEALSAELNTKITPGFEALVFKAARGIEDIYELTYIRKGGSRFPAVVSVTALRDAQNDIIGYLLIGTDNTARKQIEAEQKLLDQRLRDQQFYTRSLIESNIDAIMTTDPSGIITDVNKQMEALTGSTRDELIGSPFKNSFTDPERAESGIKKVLSAKKVTDYELTARARDNKQTVVSLNATTFYDRDRRLQGVFAAARDVTERKRLDIELESAKSVAEKANLAKSEFLSSMSHELRSPLNAILGFAQLMESDAAKVTSSQKESITQILQAGWHLLKLINEILDLAKVESGQVPLSQEPVSLAEVMLECQSMIEPQAQQRGIKLTFPRFDIPQFVQADRTRLKQVLINLLSNAIKYNREQGTVEVSCTESTPERIRISVKDSGAGLSPEQLAQLFQAFNRLGQEAGSVEGTGIGLVVAKQLVELMGGTIGMESSIGVGSVFWFELIAVADPLLAMEESPLLAMEESPLIATEESPAATAAQAQAPRAVRLHTLLYVEDNPANMKLVEQLIARHPDMSLLTAMNGNSGIEIARDKQPDVILMDINLPDINGFEALNILRGDPATVHIPVIAVSANAMPLDIERGRKAGFFRYITKPVKVDEFMGALNTALEFADEKSDK